MYSTKNFSADIVLLAFVLGVMFVIHKYFCDYPCFILVICYVLIAYGHLTRGEIPPSRFNEAHSIAFAITYSPLFIIPMLLFYNY